MKWRAYINERLSSLHMCMRHSGPCNECDLRASIRLLMQERASVERDKLRLAEALEELMSYQNGSPLPSYDEGWTNAMRLARAALRGGGE